MDPTIFMVWLSSSETDGGWWTEQAREERDHRDWSKAAPLHLSFHTSEEAARAALGRVCHAEWDRSNLAYAHGPWGSGGDSTDRMIAYMRRHCGYEAHVTEQPVALDGDEPEPSQWPGDEGYAADAAIPGRIEVL